MKNWGKVYSTTVAYRAEIVKSILEENDIAAVIVNKKESVYQLFGSYEVHVAPDDLLKAIKIVENDITFD